MEQPDIQDSVAEADATETEALDQDQLDQSADDSQEQTDAEEEDEIEIDGRKFALPKSAAEKLKAERLMQADYTRKTQEVAEQRKALEAEAQQVQRARQVQDEYVKEAAKVVAIDEQLAQFQALDWNALIDQDQTTAMKLQQQYTALQQKRAEAVGNITQKQQQMALDEQQSIAKRVQEADAYFKREIPGWSNQRSDELLRYGTEVGIPSQALGQMAINHPALAKVLHKAEMYDRLAAQKVTKPKPETQEKPVTRITAARSTVQKDPDKMSMKEWTEWRESQIKRKR